MVKGRTGPADWAMRMTLWLYALVSIPPYLWFLHHIGERVGQQLPAGDDLRFWLPIVVPLTVFSFTTMSSTSWWGSTEGRPFLLGRKDWRFLMVFVVALSLMTGFFGSARQDVVAMVLTVMVTTVGVAGLWLLPPTLSLRLLDTLPPKKASAGPS
ncbi:hypothetical protein ABZ832_28470 [Streptantibioticus parmotrematis]|uniref:hypothetical protein n=1 Tax=Streptantibioticus parmotrematis TaxID=2873249 RepID=UPI0033EB9F31